MGDSESNHRLGRFVETPVAGETVRAFVPPPLPPEPPIALLGLMDRLSLAERALGRLDGIAETANQAFDAARRIVDLFKKDREMIARLGVRASSALRVHELFQQHPFLTANQIVQHTALSAPTANGVLGELERMGMVEEVTGRKRGRVFRYSAYLAILNEGTDPL